MEILQYNNSNTNTSNTTSNTTTYTDNHSKPGIYIVRQESLDFQQFSKNDIAKQVHCVAKNLPFLIEIGSSGVNFKDKSVKLSVKLYYDGATQSDFKPVDYVKQSPMSYKVGLCFLLCIDMNSAGISE